MAAPSCVLAAVGDVMLLHPITAAMIDPASAALLDLLRSADVTVGNCELSAFDPSNPEPCPQVEAGGLWVSAEPACIADLRALGFTMMSRANNHALDFGVAGMMETDRLLAEYHIAHAGTGETLAAARAPAYVITRAGRTALISATDTAPAFARAGDARHDIRGRPGVNPLRVTWSVVVNAETFDVLTNAVDVARRHGCPLGAVNPRKQEMHVFGVRIQMGERAAPVFTFSDADVEETLKQVRLARLRADRVLFALHTHLSDADGDFPPHAVRELARRVVDAGADVIVGHGPHMLRGVEIYQGRPIFYSLGNFACHLFKAASQPGEWYEHRGLNPVQATMEDIFGESSSVWGKRDDENFWQSVIALVRFEASGLVVELRPVELSPQASGWRLGTPRIADESTAGAILERMIRLSRPLGTEISCTDGIGRIDCSRNAISA